MEIAGGGDWGRFDPPVHVSNPLVPVIRLSWGSDITPLVRCSHSQKILFCTVEVNFPIYTASTHGKIYQLVSATVFYQLMWILDGLHRHRHNVNCQRLTVQWPRIDAAGHDS